MDEPARGRRRPTIRCVEGRRRWLPHLTRATTWLLATVAAAVIGVVVSGLIGGWFPELTGEDDDDDGKTRTPTTRRVPSVRRSELVSSERIGRYDVALDGSSQGAINVHGQPDSRNRDGDACVMKWRDQALEINFYNLGGQDPCVYGRFCFADITGGKWATAKGLRVGDRDRRMFELYPDAEQVEEPGLVRRYVIEPASAPCGPSQGGLEAFASGKVVVLRVSFLAGGD
jgi:hypothetical protein